jgi:hypothetical protein
VACRKFCGRIEEDYVLGDGERVSKDNSGTLKMVTVISTNMNHVRIRYANEAEPPCTTGRHRGGHHPLVRRRQWQRSDGQEPAHEPPLKPAVMASPPMICIGRGRYQKWIPAPALEAQTPQVPDDFDLA